MVSVVTGRIGQVQRYPRALTWTGKVTVQLPLVAGRHPVSAATRTRRSRTNQGSVRQEIEPLGELQSNLMLLAPLGQPGVQGGHSQGSVSSGSAVTVPRLHLQLAGQFAPRAPGRSGSPPPPVLAVGLPHQHAVVVLVAVARAGTAGHLLGQPEGATAVAPSQPHRGH